MGDGSVAANAASTERRGSIPVSRSNEHKLDDPLRA
jgi:hypothetical protein